MGQFLGEEVMHVMRGMERMESSIEIDGRHKTVSCPGRERTNAGRAGFPGEYKDAAPVDIRLGLLKLGDIMIGAVNAEVFNPIAQRLKQESPYARTMMATLTNGMARSGYIPHDAGFGMYTFEVLSSRLQPGCAESAIVNGILDLMAEAAPVEPDVRRAAARLADDELGGQHHGLRVSPAIGATRVDEEARAAREVLTHRRQGGCTCAAIAMSSKPTTATSPGIECRAANARIALIAMTSVAANTASNFAPDRWSAASPRGPPRASCAP